MNERFLMNIDFLILHFLLYGFEKNNLKFNKVLKFYRNLENCVFYAFENNNDKKRLWIKKTVQIFRFKAKMTIKLKIYGSLIN